MWVSPTLTFQSEEKRKKKKEFGVTSTQDWNGMHSILFGSHCRPLTGQIAAFFSAGCIANVHCSHGDVKKPVKCMMGDLVKITPPNES